MSAPVYEFACTAWDFSGFYASGTGARVYLLADGSGGDVPWDTGWCSNCQTVRRIQRGMSPSELEAECGRLETEKLLAVLGGRTSLNACEHCRCTAIEIMHWEAAGPSPTVLPYLHPGCGGQLMVKVEMHIGWEYGAPLVLAPVFADARPEDDVRTRYPLPSWEPPEQRKSWFVRMMRRLRGEHYSVDPLTGQEYMLSDEVRAAFKKVEGEKSPEIKAFERVLDHRDMRDVI